MTKTMLSIIAVLALTACSGTLTRVAYPTVQSSLELRAFVGSALVQTVSLPAYAAAEELAVETAPGVITSTGDLLWADDPARAVTLEISRHLDSILSATVGPDPWPFPGLPDVGIDIRVSDMIAKSDGQFHLTGTYFIGGDGIDFRNTSSSFDIKIAIASLEAGDVAVAQSQAILRLSEDIAGKLGR